MKYPKIDRKDKKNCKLTDIQISDIKRLFKEDGFSMRRLALIFAVSRITIKYWVDEEYKAKDKQKAIARMASKRSNPEKKKELNRQRADELYKARYNIESLGKYHKKELKKLNEINAKTGRQEKSNK